MKFELRHFFDSDPDTVWTSLFCEAYEAASNEDSGNDYELLSDDSDDGVRHVRARITAGRPLPSPIARVMGSERLVYELQQRFELGRRTMKWRVIPSVASDRIQASGVYEIVDADGGCERLVKGEVSVSIPLVGGKIERGICSELTSAYEHGAEFARRWLAENT